MCTHFCTRVEERGPPDIDPHWLMREVRRAVRSGNTAFACRMQDARDGAGLYRLFLPEGIYYAIVGDSTGRPITFLRQEDLPAVKATCRGNVTSVAAWKAQRFNRDYLHDRRHRIKRMFAQEAKWHRG